MTRDGRDDTQALPDKGKVVVMKIWDTAGEEKTQSINEKFFGGVDACVFVYDVTDHYSFEILDDWYAEFDAKAMPRNLDTFPFVVMGNKTDCGKQNVSADEAKAWCRKYSKKLPIQHFEVSAKSNINVDKAFEALAPMFLQSKPKEDDKYGGSTSIGGGEKDGGTDGGCCLIF